MLKVATISDERALIGHYKSQGLTDPDEIYSEKQMLEQVYKRKKLMQWITFWMYAFVGLIAALVSAGMAAYVVVPGLALFYWFIARTKNKLKIIKLGTDAYCAQLGVPSV